MENSTKSTRRTPKKEKGEQVHQGVRGGKYVIRNNKKV